MGRPSRSMRFTFRQSAQKLLRSIVQIELLRSDAILYIIINTNLQGGIKCQYQRKNERA